MDARQTNDKKGQGPRMSYLSSSRIGRKAVTTYLPPEWVIGLKIYGARHGRPLQSLVEEALFDLAGKLGIDLNSKEQDDAGKS